MNRREFLTGLALTGLSVSIPGCVSLDGSVMEGGPKKRNERKSQIQSLYEKLSEKGETKLNFTHKEIVALAYDNGIELRSYELDTTGRVSSVVTYKDGFKDSLDGIAEDIKKTIRVGDSSGAYWTAGEIDKGQAQQEYSAILRELSKSL